MFCKKYSTALLAACTACILLLSGCNFASQGRSNEEIRLADPEATEQGTTAETAANVNEVDPEYYLGETTFIGDSRTNGLLTYQLLPPEQVFALDGSTQKTIRDDPFIQFGPDSDRLTVEQAVEQRQPHRLVIAFGVNAIPLMTEEEFMQEYDLLIDQLTGVSPNSRIVIQAILPVSGWKHQEMSYLTNENIDHYNQLLKEYSEENGYVFFDISSEFKDEEGNLAREFDAGDGLHFNQNFYQHYIQLLIQYQP